jgi:hypothetical protein
VIGNVEALESKPFNLFCWVLEKWRGERGRRKPFFFFFEGEERRLMNFFSNHALESDDKEESEYASPMIVTIC